MKIQHTFFHLKLLAGRRAVFRGKSFVLWSHLGLGDTISIFPAIEALVDSGKTVYLPTKSRNVRFVSDLVSPLEGVVVFEIQDDPNFELEAIREFADRSAVPILYAGHLLFGFLSRIKTGLGINGLLNFMAGHQAPLVSEKLKMHLLGNTVVQNKPENYVFVDHHPGTPREIPIGILEELNPEYLLINNDFNWSISELAVHMNGAKELHLVSSAPLCLALTADLAFGGKRVRYRIGDSYPLRADYPPDWLEVSLTEEGPKVVSRNLEASVPLIGRIVMFCARLQR